MNTSSESFNTQIVNYLKELESRVSRIEARLQIESKAEEKAKLPPLKRANISERTDELEFHIGQYWFAKVGIVILAIGIVFLLTIDYKNLPPILPSLAGYLLVGVIFALSYYWRNTYEYISRYLFGGALVLLYFTTLRLHYFSGTPVISDRNIVVFFLLVVTLLHLFLSERRKSVYLTGIGITLGFVTTVIGESAYFLFIMLTFLAALTVYFKLRFQWNGLFNYSIILTYFTHLIWFINFPVLGNKIELASSPYINLIFLLLYSAVFAAGNLLRNKEYDEDSGLIISTFLNCLGAYGLFLLITLTKFESDISISNFIASVVFLIFSIVFWIREKSKYSTFFYAILGYTALSVSIIAQFDKPDFFVWLSWQSLVVISTAILFRSKIIIVANFVIYLIIFIAYLILAGTVSFVSLSFGVVALVSARILNWQKGRLELQTEMMRNAYLAIALFIFPYALYHIVPSGYVILSWIGVAIVYYVMSIIIKNKKYRWMALLTLLVTAMYVIIIGIIQLEEVLRIVSFLVLGIVLLVISIFYAKMKSKSDSNKAGEVPESK